MADKHNSGIPALTNQVAEDIPDIKENLEFHKDALQRIFQTWSDTDNSAQKLDPAVGFNDATYNYEFPTNPAIAAHSVIMLGNSSTIVWMYLNTAPPGWKALSTGADTVLGVSGGAGDYNVNGGNADSSATWTIAGLTKDAHTHSLGTHTHTLADGPQITTSGAIIAGEFTCNDSGKIRPHNSSGGALTINQLTAVTGTESTANTGAQSDSAVSSDATWRPSASVGKLFQLDSA